jgi:hypothetical protein
MAKQTTTIRINKDTKDLLKELSETDRRSMIDTLDIVLLEACRKLPPRTITDAS